MISAAHEEARAILDRHSHAMERMVETLLEKETVDADEVAELFHDVPKWEHAGEGSMRIRYPENPVIPQVREQIAAASTKEEEPEEVTESLKLDRKFPRTGSRPAEA
jgi:cell division protease FtsH